jgi:hypothetical protein
VAGLVLVAAALVQPTLAGAVLRAALFGRPVFDLRTPQPGQVLAQGEVEVFVHFDDATRIAPETFRCILNGRDVTGELTRARNGAVGSLIGAVEGENHLRVEVFARAWWSERYFEDSRDVTFRVRPLPDLDRAQIPTRLGA